MFSEYVKNETTSELKSAIYSQTIPLIIRTVSLAVIILYDSFCGNEVNHIVKFPYNTSDQKLEWDCHNLLLQNGNIA